METFFMGECGILKIRLAYEQASSRTLKSMSEISDAISI